MKSGSRHLAASVVLVLVIALATGCAVYSGRRVHRATSVVEYLYPHRAEPVETVSTPVLSLPLRVGIAFVPEDGARPPQRGSGQPALSEKARITLMREIGDHFTKHDFVKSIEVIPTAYLTPRGSFANLDQLRTMFGVDVIALLSYDQVQFTDQGFLSLSYWTLVGAYVVQGEKNDTHTMLDAAVYHIPSRKLLFRAPGISRIRGSATPVNLAEELRRDSEAGFAQAAKELIVNLDEQLALFRERVKSMPEEFTIVRSPGYTGAGALDGFAALLAAGLGGYALWSCTRRPR